MTRLETDRIDRSKFTLYAPPRPSHYRSFYRGISRRIPEPLSKANGLAINALDKVCDVVDHNHKMITVNKVELCPMSAILFLAAAKNFHWSDGLKMAIDKILEVSKIESNS